MNAPLDARGTNPREGGPSFPLRHRLERAAFRTLWVFVEALCPFPIHGVRRSLLRLFGARLANTAKVYPGVEVWYPRNLAMGEHACLGPGAICYCMAPITLGRHALVSQRAHLCAGTHDIDDPEFPLRVAPIVIGAEAWVAAEAFVGPGSVVEEGAVLGARAALFGRLPAWTVAGGNPARVLRERRRGGLELNR
jgi:putative colanic acid biosynthesis acetyltransferase WcaF